MKMACEECRELADVALASPADLVSVLQVVAQECDRGVLRPLRAGELTLREHEALDSVYAADVLPSAVDYRFECRLCGDRFHLTADPAQGTGQWLREPREGLPK